jgi:hypothetical protein
MNPLVLNDLFLKQLDFNQELVSAYSRFDCHVRGLHSIVIGKAGGRLLRIYLAQPGSALHQGYEPVDMNGRLPDGQVPRPNFELGIHSHHCDLELTMLRGRLMHWTFNKISRLSLNPEAYQLELPSYKYQAKLRGEEPGFSRQGFGLFNLSDYQLLDNEWSARRAIVLRAAALHTVGIDPSQQWVAWLVAEGSPDPAYEPLTYSPRNLERYDFRSLYLPMTYTQALQLLRRAGLII